MVHQRRVSIPISGPVSGSQAFAEGRSHMSRVMPITGALAAAVLAAAPGALAQVTSGQKPDVSPWPTVGRDTGTTAALADSAYIRQAVRGNFTEVAVGRLAE